MARYSGNESVKGGFYWSPARWEIVTVPKDGGVLPGTDETRYLRLPLMLMMVVGPVMGALFVMFLPVLGFAMVIGLGGKKLSAAAMRLRAGYRGADENEAKA